MRPLSIIGTLTLLFFINNSCIAAKDLPRSIGEVKSGATPLEKLLMPLEANEVQNGSARQVRDLRSNVARLIWNRLLPNTHFTEVAGSITLYKGRVVSIYLFEPNLMFGRVQADAMRIFGKGRHEKKLVSDVLEGCDPYMFDMWIDGRVGLYLIGDEKAIGVSLHLRDNKLNYKMETDNSVHIEYEQCVEF
jgi:hypothetical protein